MHSLTKIPLSGLELVLRIHLVIAVVVYCSVVANLIFLLVLIRGFIGRRVKIPVVILVSLSIFLILLHILSVPIGCVVPDFACPSLGSFPLRVPSPPRIRLLFPAQGAT